jgi:hypothetical protein
MSQSESQNAAHTLCASGPNQLNSVGNLGVKQNQIMP